MLIMSSFVSDLIVVHIGTVKWGQDEETKTMPVKV
jgi:hypothetical protein